MQVYPGSNIYSHKPVIRMEIELGKLVDVPTNNIAGFNEQLIQLFLGLKEHKCSLDMQVVYKKIIQWHIYCTCN